jgi:hypothetical protein
MSERKSTVSDGDKKKLRLAIAEITGIKNRYQNLTIIDEALATALTAIKEIMK